MSDIPVEPGDSIVVVDPEPEPTIDASVDDFSSTTDESTNVIVNVEVPEPETSGEPDAVVVRLDAIESKLDAVLALQVVDVLDDVPEPEPEPEPEPLPDVVEVGPESEPEPEPEPEPERESKRGSRRFGR